MFTMLIVYLYEDRSGPKYNENSMSSCKWYAYMLLCVTMQMQAKFKGFEMGSLLRMHIAGLRFQRAMPIGRE